MLNKWYDNTVTQTADILEVDLKKGLTKAETEERIKKYGYNELKEKKKAALIQKIFNQLSNFLVIILILASIISISLGEKADSIVIISIVIINAVLGVVQESKAEKALEALKKMSAPNARVLRNGKIGVVPARILVPGDIVLIEAGDIVP
ncbi:MAG: cation-transporting P-type ATPase, partial [Clostridiaceae bacterium]